MAAAANVQVVETHKDMRQTGTLTQSQQVRHVFEQTLWVLARREQYSNPQIMQRQREVHILGPSKHQREHPFAPIPDLSSILGQTVTTKRKPTLSCNSLTRTTK